MIIRGRVGLIWILGILCLGVNSGSKEVFSEEVSTFQIEMDKYTAQIRNDGMMSILREGKVITQNWGSWFHLRPIDNKGEDIYTSPAKGILISVKQIAEGKEAIWGSTSKEIGFIYQCRAIFKPQKIIFNLKYEFTKDCRIGAIGFWPRIFSDNSENLFGCKYEVLDVRGKSFKGEFANILPEEWITIGDYLGEIKIYSKLGVVTFKIGIDYYDSVSLGGGDGNPYHFCFFLKPPETNLFPSGYGNNIELVIDFNSSGTFL